MAEMLVADLDRALYEQRTLVKHLAMRRTLFVFPRELLGAAQAVASARVAGQERRRLVKQVEEAGLHADGEGWLERAMDAVGEALTPGREASSAELRDEIPLLEGEIVFGEGKRWGGSVPIGPRVLTVMNAEGRILRGSNDGRWTTSRPLWTATSSWLGAEIESLDAATGVRTLVEQWLGAFGPGTFEDIQWWLGATKTAVREALAGLEVAEVDLGEGPNGYALADDLEVSEPVQPWAALLPSLDPTTMGWKERDWYLGAHAAHVFDRNGNAGATAWWDGRIVGGWRQDDSGAVEVQLLEDVGAEARTALEAEAARLTEWLAGTRIAPRFPAPLAKV